MRDCHKHASSVFRHSKTKLYQTLKLRDWSGRRTLTAVVHVRRRITHKGRLQRSHLYNYTTYNIEVKVKVKLTAKMQ